MIVPLLKYGLNFGLLLVTDVWVRWTWKAFTFNNQETYCIEDFDENPISFWLLRKLPIKRRIIQFRQLSNFNCWKTYSYFLSHVYWNTLKLLLYLFLKLHPIAFQFFTKLKASLDLSWALQRSLLQFAAIVKFQNTRGAYHPLTLMSKCQILYSYVFKLLMQWIVSNYGLEVLWGYLRFFAVLWSSVSFEDLCS